MPKPRKFENPKVIGFKMEKEMVEKLDELWRELDLESRSTFLRKIMLGMIKQGRDQVNIQNTNMNFNINVQSQSQQQIQRLDILINAITADISNELEKVKKTLTQAEEVGENSKLKETILHSPLYKSIKKSKQKVEEAIQSIRRIEEGVKNEYE